MKLLTKELRRQFPKLGETDGENPSKVKVVAKFFTPWTSWTWYATEGQPELNEKDEEADFTFFGFVSGLENELGYFLLSELEQIRGPYGLRIERDLYFEGHTLAEVMEKAT